MNDTSLIIRYVVTAIDSSDLAVDHKPCVLGVFKTEEEAKDFITNDMKDWIDEQVENSKDWIIDFEHMRIYNENWAYGGEWNINKIIIND